MTVIDIGFTGTQRGMTQEQADKVAELLVQASEKYSVTGHHGDCIGADHDFHKMLRLQGHRVWLHPPDNPDKRAFCDYDDLSAEIPYLDRNKEIVNSSKTLIATPGEHDEIVRSGTWSTIRYARDNDKPRVIVYPDGTIGK